MGVQYRVGATRTDDPAVLRVWRDNLNLSCEPAPRSRWLYEQGQPGAHAGFGLALAALGEEGERIVGSAGVVGRRLWLTGQEQSAGLHIDLAVDAPHRTLRPALMLVREARAAATKQFDFLLGFPNDQSLPVFRRLRYQVLGRTERLARVLRHARYIERVVGLPGVGPVGGRILDCASAIKNIGMRIRSGTAQRLEWVSGGFDERFDELFVAARGQYPLVGDRSSAFLSWRFEQEPNGQTDVAALANRGRSHALAAYAVLRRQGARISIRDLFGFHDELGAFLDLLLPALRARGAEVVSFELMAPLWLAELLHSRGFQSREAGASVVLSARPEALAPEPDAWFLTDADRDT